MTNAAKHFTPVLVCIQRGAALSVAVFLLATVALQSAQAQTYTVIHEFGNGGDGATPQAGLTMDAAGNFYGTTTFGGYQGSGLCQADGGCGVVFKLSHRDAGWVVDELYKFLGGSDGSGPLARVVFGPDGALYGRMGAMVAASMAVAAAQSSGSLRRPGCVPAFPVHGMKPSCTPSPPDSMENFRTSAI